MKEDGNASATWNDTNNVIDVSYKGYETTINPNTGTITVLVKSGETETSVAVGSVSVSPTTLSLTVGGETGTVTETIVVTPNEESNKTVTWRSSDEAVATVSGGVVTAVGPGTAIITAISTKDETKSASCTVTVTATVVNYTGITPGTTVNYTANGMTTADGGTPTWEVLYANGTDLYIITKEKCLSPDNTINFGNYNYSAVLTDTNGTAYSGTNLINSEPVQKGLMSEMVTFLSNSSNIITNASAQKNIQATNYMLDTAKWSGWATGTGADWAMGGPTLELLCMAYNQLYNLSSADSGYKWPTVLASTSVGYASILEEYEALGEASSTNVFNHDSDTYYWLASPDDRGGDYIKQGYAGWLYDDNFHGEERFWISTSSTFIWGAIELI